MVIATCALKSAENVSYVVAYVRVAAGRFWAGFPLGIGRTPSDRCKIITDGREPLVNRGPPAPACPGSLLQCGPLPAPKKSSR